MLTEEGNLVAEGGSHEALVYNAVPEVGGIAQAEIMVLITLHTLFIFSILGLTHHLH